MSFQNWVLVALGLGFGYGIFRAIQAAVEQYRRGGLYDLEQKEKDIAKANSKLSDDDLLKQANAGLGITPKPPADSPDKKG